ncbi:MAG: hypothetical protein IJU71_03085 [Selenomonadaceae bacterium]|nr:hypothetical protein [Selenomonadaceae bacterium]
MDIFISALILQIILIVSAFAQIMLKRAAQVKHASPINDYLNPLVIGAYIILLATTFPTIYVYKVLPLSLGSVLSSMGYIYVTAMSVRLLDEKITRRKIFALALITIGVIVFSVS